MSKLSYNGKVLAMDAGEAAGKGAARLRLAGMLPNGEFEDSTFLAGDYGAWQWFQAVFPDQSRDGPLWTGFHLGFWEILDSKAKGG